MAIVMQLRPIRGRVLITSANLMRIKSQAEQYTEFVRRRVQSELQTYPVPTRNPTTGNLSRRWGISKTRSENKITIHAKNYARYAVYVHGDQHGIGQQEQHAETEWPLMKDVIDFWAEDLTSSLQDLIRTSLAAGGA